ncbi:Kelch repeat-containing protein [Actinokineospora soli]|uniref:Kelch repeat-containing protein n=1 Tax=Actinokineospora soli TaxID=1048753 RepID=A0ABW2TMQ2_9PSEU
MPKRLLIAVALLAAACAAPSRPLPAYTPPAGPTSGPTTAARPAWRALADAPTARTEVTATRVGGEVVVVGGMAGTWEPLRRTEVYDIAADRWRPGPDLPAGAHHAMSATVDGRAYVFGGYDADRAPMTGAYRLDGDTWTPLAPLPSARAAGTAVAVGATVYVAGGIGPDGLADRMLVYDTEADRWSDVPGPPTPREHLAGVALDGRVHTIGGRVGANLGDHEVYDPATAAWSRLPRLPTARSGLGAAAPCPGLAVVVGGEGADTFPQVEAYSAGRWSALPPSPTPRHGLGVVAVDGAVLALAGGPRPGLTESAAAEVLSVPCGR